MYIAGSRFLVLIYTVEDPVICDDIVLDVMVHYLSLCLQVHRAWASPLWDGYIKALQRTIYKTLDEGTACYFTCWTWSPSIVLGVMFHHPPLHLLLKGVCGHFHAHKGVSALPKICEKFTIVGMLNNSCAPSFSFYTWLSSKTVMGLRSKLII